MCRGRLLVVVLAYLLSSAAWLGVPDTGFAQSILSGGRIEAIRIEGTQRIEAATVRSYMRVNPGDPFDPVRLDDSLKNLFSTGLFADVRLEREGNTLIVVVSENPIVNRIAFEGNQRIDDDTLAQEIELRPRVVFTRTKVQSDTDRILEIYRRSGRFAATVEPKVIQLEQNRVDLAFEIDEGPLTSIRAINFIGNREFSDSTLRDEVTTSEESFWNFFSTSDTYDPDRLTFDRELLRRFYLNEGYADFRVVSVIAELTPDQQDFIITFTVEEGPRYRFGRIGLETGLRNLDPETLRSEVTTEEGDWYDAGEVDKTIEVLTDAVGDLGYAFVDIRPRVQRDRENLTIDILYDIQEGPKVFVERIDIEGNSRTLDRVIRREFRLVEGDAFNTSKLRRSRQRVQNLGFFKTVTVENEPGSAPDRTVVKVAVEEQSTGDVTFGAGFSSSDGPIGNIGIRERNLLGRGQDLRLGFTLAGEATELDFSFTEPYFLDRNLAAGIDLYRTTDDRTDESGYEEERLGGSVRAGFNITDEIRDVVRYTLENRDITDVDNSASLLVRSERGATLRSGISNELTYDTRDSRFDPREGVISSLRTEFFGLGGDASFVRASATAGYYYTVFEDYTLSVRGTGGTIVGVGEDTRISDRFFKGGGSPRGFEYGGIGPRDGRTNDALGGKNFYTGTVEASFPLNLPFDLDIRGRVFTDVGAAWDIDDNSIPVNLQDSSDPRVTVGTGISWNSPFGPVVVDLGIAVIKEDFDETELLSFSFGTQF
ncbi:outer membrane protein assembly factor BamA [Pelagibius marinus]|uniref:outer membrane protein assembly factor BamA n=1 Tax=Pelagibius marinus TaxID=2762760 RepID=UPI0018730117|nr:outer membrane protein assembly factor BamA [Pelagibius marinus]